MRFPSAFRTFGTIGSRSARRLLREFRTPTAEDLAQRAILTAAKVRQFDIEPPVAEGANLRQTGGILPACDLGGSQKKGVVSCFTP